MFIGFWMRIFRSEWGLTAELYMVDWQYLPGWSCDMPQALSFFGAFIEYLPNTAVLPEATL